MKCKNSFVNDWKKMVHVRRGVPLQRLFENEDIIFDCSTNINLYFYGCIIVFVLSDSN